MREELNINDRSEAKVLSKALLRAGHALGLTQTEIGRVIGKGRTSITRGIDPSSKSGELAVLLIRVYRGLYSLVGGNPDDMKHWMDTNNKYTQGFPSKQIQTMTGLNTVLTYIEAIQ